MLPLKNILLVAFAATLSIVSCSKRDGRNPLVQNEYEVFDTGVPGLSGLCFNVSKTSFYAVSDGGGIYELFQDGTTKRKLPYSGSNDFEAITINPVTGKLYLADESSMDIFSLSDDEQKLAPITHIAIQGGVKNKGIEGLAYGRDTLYIANQESPTLLISYALSTQTEAGRKQVSFAKFLSDVFFDDTDATLWFCDSRQQLIFHCTKNGDVIASQEINYVPKAEALVIDRKANTAWVGCDQTSKLFKIKLKI